jgi:hypothetical protein
LYDAMATHDAGALLRAMHVDFSGTVSERMPLAVGAPHVGPERMLLDVWAKVFAAYDVTPEVTRYVETSGQEVVAIGHYIGTRAARDARSTRRSRTCCRSATGESRPSSRSPIPSAGTRRPLDARGQAVHGLFDLVVEDAENGVVGGCCFVRDPRVWCAGVCVLGRRPR